MKSSRLDGVTQTVTGFLSLELPFRDVFTSIYVAVHKKGNCSLQLFSSLYSNSADRIDGFEEGICQPQFASMGILREECPASYYYSNTQFDLDRMY